jgi:hypothetical protein
MIANGRHCSLLVVTLLYLPSKNGTTHSFFRAGQRKSWMQGVKLTITFAEEAISKLARSLLASSLGIACSVPAFVIAQHNVDY